ncbi:hypothetical protein PAPYR_566 [Paratrimastix pyriformis]|uniref:Uncharacterized protein n=1 Tax=Paratrimastix pyriformis TaxID=342808 RepID=A0ABQ8V0I1_9EUKA|nr:hypothetical protein PAPYR_566 [Paratrimastix pyriformis]
MARGSGSRDCVEGISPSDGGLRVPSELLRAIVEASSCPLHAYIQMLSLSRAIRAGIQDALIELSFVASDPVLSEITPTITTDALAALVALQITLQTHAP